ncbi:DUF2267 domain-containing protein [Celeribacter indicus]|uniref:DUF2267 domain-containing protein n=1 Tax=Celeribacter indicus TaxID=1208324 RepID=A0A0B5E592_9RHOB|nr:DUF2267 domain-containing protein [Celeribacter indicus]AJE48555.1 hypothetical protein P73_3840 [Celeribacter indicus]SDX08346.1 Uncharacterized conserved protein, DUF2267 family [Celeribacter indicus]
MTMPWTYRHAQKEFRSFLADAKGRMGHVMESDNMTYTAVDGVLQVFRRRLTPPQVIAFGDAIPSLLRAMLVYNWRVDAVPLPFGTRAEMIREAQSLRKAHNITPLNVIEATAYALWRHSSHHDLERVLAGISPEAVAFWTVPGVSAKELEQRII